MIFQHTWKSVIWGSKTQTRRIAKPIEILSKYMTDANPHWMPCVLHHVDGNVKWYAQHTYAVQPGRGKPTMVYCPDHPCYGIDIVEPDSNEYKSAKAGTWNWKGQGYKEARIQITDIRKEDVRDISDEDVKAEGFENFTAFMATWIDMHDITFKKVSQNQSLWNVESVLRAFLKNRPDDRYQAWVLTFCLVTS